MSNLTNNLKRNAAGLGFIAAGVLVGSAIIGLFILLILMVGGGA